MATIKDVAREAGVAVGTVSKFLNNKPMRENFRLRVEKAVEKLGYQVNTYARGFKIQRTDTVALILPDIRDPFFSSLAHFVEKALERRNYKMLLCSSAGDRDIELKCINMAKQYKVDGIIGITYNNIDDAVTTDIPFVSIDRHFSAQVPCVTADNYGGGMMAAAKLLELGCEKPAYVGSGSMVFGEADRRRAGFEEGCRQKGIIPHIFHFFEKNNVPEEETFLDLFTQHIRDGVFDFDGLFVVTDRQALEVIAVLGKLCLKVPEQVQVIGFDGIRKSYRSEFLVSTIRQPVEQMAEVSVSHLLTKDRQTIPALTALPVEYCPSGTTRD
jgi:LacI family transcriptional regulator